jgi:DNA-binding transcriptional regulator YdaS (Cro superfamily)
MKPNRPKELPGGVHTIPIEWHGEEAFPVAITHFDPGELDSFADRLREAVKLGQPLEPLLAEWERAMEFPLMCRGITFGLAEIIGAKKPRVVTAALAFMVGMDIMEGESQPEVARKLGISKQALNQTIESLRQRLAEKFGTKILCISMRDEAAREKMRTRNYRRRKKS